MAAAAPGYYDRSGRWIAGPTTGRYDADGRWLAGQTNGRRDANGVWVADPQPGYYDNGRWVRGEARGYYDARGRWVSMDGEVSRASYAPTEAGDLGARITRIEERIRRRIDNGSMSRMEANQALRTVEALRRDEAMLSARVDRLNEQLRADRRDQRDDRRPPY